MLAALTAVAVLERLRELEPDQFRPEHLRTVQRLVELRRAATAREVLLGTLPLTVAAELPARAA